MRKLLVACLVSSLVSSALLALNLSRPTEAAAPAEPMIGHMVYFTLKDNSPAAKARLVEACKKYLDKHPGTVFYGAGPRAEEFNRPVNDKDWDVALQLVFKNKAAHDKYQDDPRHIQFIEENKDNWKSVRVFDANVTQ